MNKRSGEETRLRIIAAARQVFTEQGYESASIRSISNTAGISVGGLYLYFNNKAELYQIILEDWLEELQGRTRKALSKARNPQEEIVAFITESLSYVQQHREMFLLQSGVSCSLGKELKQQFFRERRRILAEIIQKGCEQNIFYVSDPDETARIIFNLLRGFIVSLMMEQEALFKTESCLDLVLNGLIRR